MTSTQQEKDPPTIILIAGHWLGGWAWKQVAERLNSLGFHTVALTLPGLDGQDPERTSKTLHDQADAIQAAVDAGGGDVVLVAHSGANAPTSIVLDRIPQRIKRVVWVDSGPITSGSTFAPGLPDSVDALPLPPFEELGKQASLEGLSAEHLEHFRLNAVPEPGPVLRGSAHLTNNDRRKVPTTLVCCSMSGAQIMEMARAGHPIFAEVAKIYNPEIVDLPTGHWPMWSRPNALADTIGNASRRDS